MPHAPKHLLHYLPQTTASFYCKPPGKILSDPCLYLILQPFATFNRIYLYSISNFSSVFSFTLLMGPSDFLASSFWGVTLSFISHPPLLYNNSPPPPRPHTSILPKVSKNSLSLILQGMFLVWHLGSSISGSLLSPAASLNRAYISQPIYFSWNHHHPIKSISNAISFSDSPSPMSSFLLWTLPPCIFWPFNGPNCIIDTCRLSYPLFSHHLCPPFKFKLFLGQIWPNYLYISKTSVQFLYPIFSRNY